MKHLVRLVGICSVVMAGAIVTTPAFAHDDSAESGETADAKKEAHHGMHKLFERAFEDAKLRPEQKVEVDKLMAEAAKRHEPAKKAKGEFMLALADQIDDNKIDRCKLADQTKALAKAKAEAMPGDREAMEKLHGILDSTQRGLFIDSVKSQFEEAKKAHSSEALVEKMGRDLKLSDEQKTSLKEIIEGLKQIRDAEPGYQKHKARMGRLLEAFKGEQFDIDAVAPLDEDDALEKSEKRIEARLWAAEAIIPVLTDEQRDVVAKKLRDKANRHMEATKTAEDKAPPAEDKAESEEEEDDD
jgi:hypothetical protein